MTRLTKTLAYEHIAKKKQVGEKDIIDKFDVIKLLKSEFNLIGLTGEPIFIPESVPVQYHRMPDITILEKNIVIELDGEIHGNGDEVTARSKDLNREPEYKRAGFRLIVINKEDTQGYKKDLVLKILEDSLK